MAAPDMRTDYHGLQSSRYTINVAGVGHDRHASQLLQKRRRVRPFWSVVIPVILAEDGGIYGIHTTDIE